MTGESYETNSIYFYRNLSGIESYGVIVLFATINIFKFSVQQNLRLEAIIQLKLKPFEANNS